MNLSEINTNLNENLYKSFVFYIPQTVFDFKPELIEELIEYRIVDELVLINEKGDVSLVEDAICSLEIMKKSGLLNTNKFLLLDAKGSYETEQYQPLFDSYVTQLSLYVYMTNWMQEHIIEQNFEATDEQKEALKLQSHLFKVHEIEVERLCRLKPTSSNVEFSISNFNKQKPNFFKDISKKVKTIPTSKEPTIKKKKKILLTDEEAEHFLIEQLFAKI